jgi:hypothetical protein
MSGEVKLWPKVAGRAEVPPPKRIMRPCDYGLLLAVDALETQLGTIEAYNRMCEAAAALRAAIDAGQAKPQNPMFAVHPRGG